MMEELTYTEAMMQEYKTGIGALSDKMPEMTSAFHKFTEACFTEGALSEKHKQLIALSVSICLHNEYCMLYHAKGCVDAGGTDEEIMEAVGVAAALCGGTAMSYAVTILQDALLDLRGASPLH